MPRPRLYPPFLLIFALLLPSSCIENVQCFGVLTNFGTTPRYSIRQRPMPPRSTTSGGGGGDGKTKQNPAFLQRDRQRNAFHPTTSTSNPLLVEEPHDTIPAPNQANYNGNQRVPYGMASVDLSAKWWELVRDEQVMVTTTVPASNEEGSEESEEMIGVSYGVRLHPHDNASFMEFVEPANMGDNDEIIQEMHPKIAAMNATLKQAAAQLEKEIDDNLPISNNNNTIDTSSGIQCRFDGDFVAQLQLVRTLRPPPSPGFGSTAETDFRTSSTPPPYSPETDSFVTGPLRLQLRPLVAQLSLSVLRTAWDVYHNISPADVRGHFLLLPTLQDETNNWRGQVLVESDCYDLVRLTASIRPIGSLLVCFNSVGAGASQNHIHCHLWPAPAIPLLLRQRLDQKGDADNAIQSTTTNEQEAAGQEEEEEENHHDHSHSHAHHDDDDNLSSLNNGWSCYAPSRVESIYDFMDLGGLDGEEEDALIEVSYLNYPCFCVQLSTGSTTTPAKTVESLHALSKALWTVLSCIGDAPHNVCMINRPSNKDDNNAHEDKDDGCVNVDVFVFVRSRERSPNIVPASKAGASEMMGVFHCHNLQQLEELVAPTAEGKLPPMAQVLEDVSHENPAELWETMKEELSKI